MVKKKIYISGKITGLDNYKEYFEEAKKMLEPRWHVISPVELCKDIPEGSPWETYMKQCIKGLMDAEVIFMMENWGQSRGATDEHFLADRYGIDIIYENEYRRNQCTKVTTATEYMHQSTVTVI